MVFLLERPQEQSSVAANIRVTQRVTREPLGQHPHDNGSQAVMGIPRHHLVPQPEQSGVGGASGIATPHEVHDIISCAPYCPSRPLPDSLNGISIQSAPQAGVEGVQLGGTVVALQHGVQGQRLPKVTHPSTRTGSKHVLGKGWESGEGRKGWEGGEAVGERGKAGRWGEDGSGAREGKDGRWGEEKDGRWGEDREQKDGRWGEDREQKDGRWGEGRTKGGVRIERGRTEAVGERGRMDGWEGGGWKGGCGNQVK